MRKIVVIGGGLAGLISSIQLVRAGIPCTLIEKKSYPLHRVCGEYVSNEALPFLKASGLYPEQLNLPRITYLELSSIKGVPARLPLDLGGFGISRYTFDHHLYEIARREGVNFQLNSEVREVTYDGEGFDIVSQSGTLSADVVIGSFGKRSRLDVQQNRSFIKKRSPWVGVKYHVQTQHPNNLISLHIFPGGYCGVCNVEDGITNLCYLTHRDNLRHAGEIHEMEREVLFRNPRIQSLFGQSTFLFKKPEVINEISFQTKAPVENHILMTGDAAGMITPLCGNGMAMAIHSAKILCELLVPFCRGDMDRNTLEERYKSSWNHFFKRRLWFGRAVQHFLRRDLWSSLAVSLARSSAGISSLVVRGTHGEPF